MKILNEKPPIWDEVVEMVGAVPTRAIFCWGDTIYNPSNINVPDYLVVHEEVHSKQQQNMGGPEAWWARYLDDEYFRIDQEKEAYRAQLKFMYKKTKDRNTRAAMLYDCAKALSSEMYGSVINQKDALALLKI